MCQAFSSCRCFLSIRIRRWVSLYVKCWHVFNIICNISDPLSKLFSLYACHYGKDDQRNPEFAAQAKAAIFLVWRSTLEDLQRVPLDEHGFVDSCKETWVGFGQDIGLDPATHNEEEDALLKAHASRHIRTKRCQYRDCMCSTHSPTHKMRICTGCWRARYCSTKCQAR